MKLLLDHNVSRRLRKHIVGHDVFSAEQLNVHELKNGMLLEYAERNHFDVLVTADQNIFYQQNNAMRRVGLVVLSTNRWVLLLAGVGKIIEAIAASGPASFTFVNLGGMQGEHLLNG